MKTNDFPSPVSMKKKPLPAVTVYGEGQQAQELSKRLYSLIPGQQVRFVTPATRDDLMNEVYHSAIVFVMVNDPSDANISLARELSEMPGVVADIIAITPVQEIRQRLHMLTYDFDNIFNWEILATEDFQHIFKHKLKKGIMRLQARIQEDEFKSFQGFLSVSPDAFIIFDKNKRILFVSDHYHKLYRNSADALVRGTPVAQMFAAAAKETGVSEDDPRYAEAKQFWMTLKGQFEFRYNDRKVLRIVAVPMPNGQGTIVTTTDISLYKQQERALAEKQDALQLALKNEQEASSLQKQFISMVSHEFRNPLTIIDGNAQIMQRRIDTLKPEEVQKRLKTIRSAVSRLVNMMEAVLSSNMIKTGKLDLYREDFDVGALIRELVQEQADLSSRHKITCELIYMPPLASLDRKVLTIILTNLLSNAVKFCKDNPVVAVSARMDVKDNLIISIEDEGIGIPQNELAHIFDRFYRATTSSGIPGSGVGLALVKELVTLHGGEINVQSAVGTGTRFEVIFHSCKAGSAQAERAENHV